MREKIYLSPPHMGGKEIEYIKEAFASNWIAPLGPQVNAFETDVAKRIGVKGALALSSGTAAIHLSLKALGVKEGDYVFCSDLTFSGSCNPIMYEKAIPVFIDSEPESWNMSPKALEKALDWARREGKPPKAIIIVDLYGQSADYSNLLPICEKYNVPVIEDAAEAMGSMYNKKACGSFGNLNIFSFNGNKIVTTSGGGMVVSNDLDALAKMKFWATQSKGDTLWYEHNELGYNYRLSNISAAIGRGQMDVLDEHINRRKAISEKYRESFSQNKYIKMMPILSNGKPNYWLSVLSINDDSPVKPLEIIKSLENENIEARPVWKPMHMQPYFKEYPFFMHDGYVGEDIFNKGICLPSGSSLSDDNQAEICRMINKLYG